MIVKKPIYYPKLPRAKREKRLYGGKRANWTSTVVYFDETWADWYSNGTLLDANLINTRVKNTLLTASKSYVNVPDWKVKVAKGVDASAAYAREGINKFYPARYTCNSVVKVGLTTYYSTGRGTVQGGNYYAPKAFEPLETIAAGRLKHKLSGYIGNAQLAAPLAESREIHRLVRQINGLGMDALRAALALKKTKGKSVSKLFGDVWLGFGFGINPMLKDIKSAADSILKYTTRQDQRVTVRAGARDEWLSGSKAIAGSAAYGADYGFAHTSKHEQSVVITAGIDLQTRSAASYSMADHLGLKIEQVPSVLWELTPFSWVVDYVTTVGPWLDDMFYTLPGVTKYIVSSKKYRCVTLGNVYFTPAFGFTTICKVTGAGGTSVVDYFTFSRAVLAQLPSQPLRVKSVDEIASHGLTKILNLASVIAGRHGGPQLRMAVRPYRPKTRRAPGDQYSH